MNISKTSVFEIDGKKVGSGNPCYIIGEIGINHNGDLATAKKLIDVAVDAKADAVKFQKRDINSLYKQDVLKNPNIDSQGLEILLDVLNEIEFSFSEYEEIVEYCKNSKITFLCTPWDKKSVDFLEKFNVPAFKIASADLTNFPLIKYLCKKNKPLLISSGMSTMDEIEKTLKFLKINNASFVLMHSNSTYPAPTELLNLNLIPLLKEKFDVPIGYSGHESNIIPSITAVNLGSVVIERHITLDKTMNGLDQSASLEPDEFKTLVEFVRESEKSRGKAIKKMTRGEILQKEVLAKSLVCSKNISKGDSFSEENIDVKGPSKGLSPQFYYEILGKKSPRDIKVDEFLFESDIQ